MEKAVFAPGSEKSRLRSTPKTEPAIMILNAPMRHISNAVTVAIKMATA